MNVFSDYHDARKAAQARATEYGADYAIRRVNEYGRTRYVVSMACKMDSDYARAEIVYPVLDTDISEDGEGVR